MSEMLEWRDDRFRDAARALDAPGFAQEFLRRTPAYISGYRDLVAALAPLTDLRQRYDLLVAFAQRWGLSFPG